jgi:glycosidase
MKKYIIVLIFLLVFSLSACTKDSENTITFNVEPYHQIDYIIGSGELDISSIEVTNTDGEDISNLISLPSDLDLSKQGAYEVQLSVTDKDGTTASLIIIVRVISIDCEINKDHEVCYVGVSGIELSNVLADTLYIGDTYNIYVNVLPSDATNKKVTFSSSDDTVASISEFGKITTNSEGTVVFTITTVDGGFSIDKEVTVIEKSCSIDPTQEKCYESILSDQSRLTTFGDPNISGTNYQELYPKNDLYYEIFVRTFADSDNDNIGDINGVTANIPYLKTLGVNAIWFMPIMTSRSDHGYETDDYYGIDPEYGTIDDFNTLLSTAHNNDIDVIIDLVINHMGARNPIFQDVLKNGVTSEYYDWFVWADNTDPRVDDKKYDGGPIWYSPQGRDWLKDGSYTIHQSLYTKSYYALFSDWMPDLNLENPEVVAYIFDVIDYWLLDVGVDGFRLDATSHFYHNDEYNISNSHEKNVAFLTALNQHVLSVNEDAYIVAEAWEGYQVYGTYFESGVSMFDFQTNYILKDAINGTRFSPFTEIESLYNYYKTFDANFINASFISNHDMDRASTVVGEVNMKLAAEMLLTLPGNPFIYYGDELAMRGTRTSMLWGEYYDQMYVNIADFSVDSVSTQINDPNSILSTFQELGTLRESNLALRYGDYHAYSSNGLSGFVRVFDDNGDKEVVVVLFNLDDEITRSVPSEFTSYEILYSTFDNNYGGLSPRSTMIIRIPFEDIPLS